MLFVLVIFLIVFSALSVTKCIQLIILNRSSLKILNFAQPLKFSYLLFYVFFIIFSPSSYERLGSEVDSIFPSAESRSQLLCSEQQFTNSCWRTDNTLAKSSSTLQTLTRSTTNTTTTIDNCNTSTTMFATDSVLSGGCDVTSAVLHDRALCDGRNSLHGSVQRVQNMAISVESSSAPAITCLNENHMYPFFTDDPLRRRSSSEAVNNYSFYSNLAPAILSKSYSILSTCTNIWPGFSGFGSSNSKAAAIPSGEIPSTELSLNLADNVSPVNSSCSIDGNCPTNSSYSVDGNCPTNLSLNISSSISSPCCPSHSSDQKVFDYKAIASDDAVCFLNSEMSYLASPFGDHTIPETSQNSPRSDSEWLATFGGANCRRCSCPGRCRVGCHCRSYSTSSEDNATTKIASSGGSYGNRKSSLKISITTQLQSQDPVENVSLCSKVGSIRDIGSDYSEEEDSCDDGFDGSDINDTCEIMYDTEDTDFNGRTQSMSNSNSTSHL